MKHLKYLLGGALAAGVLASCHTLDNNGEVVHADQTVSIIAFNDFHGNLEPPKLSIKAPNPTDSTKDVFVPAGGVAYMADAIDKLRAKNPNNAVVTAGDLISASPLISSLFLDEPTIDVMSQIKIDFSAVGNHEFDRGTKELRRLQNGGCEKNTATEPCQINKSFSGAKFSFLAANVEQKIDGKTIFAPYKIKEFGGIPVAFIGMTLRNTPSIVAASGITDVTFKDEADTVNALIPELKKQGVQAFVVLLHEGAAPTTPFNKKTCDGLNGDILDILNRLDSSVDVVVSGHTHQSYLCDYGTVNPAKPFLLTSAGQYGTLLTNITLNLDGKTGKVVKKDARQVIVQGEEFSKVSAGVTVVTPLTDLYEKFVKNNAVESIVKQYRDAVAVVSNRVVGKLTGSLTRTQVASKESTLGNTIADSQLEASKGNGAQFALMNPGGVRADLNAAADGSVTFGQIFTVQPFGNIVMTISLTGAQIKDVIEQQWSGTNAANPRILYPSEGLSYSYKSSGSLPRASNIMIQGKPIVDNQSYRVTVNNFLADGGDGFTGLQKGTNRVGAGQDIDAFEAYIRTKSPLAPAATNRLTVLP
ncbi:MAG: bifunctional metallophosphatase/5'-nucleotidase [Aquirhabdus sp.]